MIEQKIAEIVCSLHTVIHSEKKPCKRCKDTIDQIQALIASEQQTMVEALKDAKFVIEQTTDGVRYNSTKKAILAKIDAALAKGEGK